MLWWKKIKWSERAEMTAAEKFILGSQERSLWGGEFRTGSEEVSHLGTEGIANIRAWGKKVQQAEGERRWLCLGVRGRKLRKWADYFLAPVRSVSLAVSWKTNGGLWTWADLHLERHHPFCSPLTVSQPCSLLACSQLGGCQHFNYSSQRSVVYNSTIKQALGNMLHLWVIYLLTISIFSAIRSL